MRVMEKRFDFEALPLAGAFVARAKKIGDERGFFARRFCAREFAEQGLPAQFAQVNHAGSVKKGTLRGMHYQLPPKAETKIVSVVRGAVWDVILDLRPGSATFGEHAAAELSADNGKMMCVPKGFAHGYISLTDDAEIIYFVDEYYAPELERGIRWDDPAFNIPWPLAPAVMSERDRAFADFSKETHL